MNPRQQAGRSVLLFLFKLSLGLALATALSLGLLGSVKVGLLLFLPGNLFYFALFAYLLYSGQRGLRWAMVYVFALRGVIEVFAFWHVAGLSAWSADGKTLVRVLPSDWSWVVQGLGVATGVSFVVLAGLLVLVPQVREYLEYRRLTTNQCGEGSM